MQIITPMVSTKTRTASVSGRLALFICNSREKNHIVMCYYWKKKKKRNEHLNVNFVSGKEL